MTGGFYNHYDDPDEFWDEEPLIPSSKTSSHPHREGGFSSSNPPSPLTPPAPVTHTFSQTSSTPRNTATTNSSASQMTKLGITPPQKSSLVSVEVGSDRLPIGITLGRSWKNSFDPTQYGQSIIDSYRYGLYVLAARMVESGVLPPSTLPSLRDAAPLLLKTRTIDEFRELYDHLFLASPTTVHGPGVARTVSSR